MPQALDSLRELFDRRGPIAPMPDPRRRRFIMNEGGDDIVTGGGLPEEEQRTSPAVEALGSELRGGGSIRSFRDPVTGTMTYTNRGTPPPSPEDAAAEELRRANIDEEMTRSRNRMAREMPVAQLTSSAGYQRLLREDPAAAARAQADVMLGASRMGEDRPLRRPNIQTPGEEFSGVRSLLASGRAKQDLAEEAADAETNRFLSPKATAARGVAAAEREFAGRPERFGRIRERLAGNPDLSMLTDDPMGTLGLQQQPGGGEGGGGVASMADVQDFARENGMSVAAARAMFESEGWVIEP